MGVQVWAYTLLPHPYRFHGNRGVITPGGVVEGGAVYTVLRVCTRTCQGARLVLHGIRVPGYSYTGVHTSGALTQGPSLPITPGTQSIHRYPDVPLSPIRHPICAPERGPTGHVGTAPVPYHPPARAHNPISPSPCPITAC